MKSFLTAAALLVAAAAQAQTVPFDPSAPVRAGRQNETNLPPVNPALNQSTIQGPTQVQRTLTNRDPQPSRIAPEQNTVIGGTPDQSPTAVPDAREQPLMQEKRDRRQSSDVVPTRNRRSNSSNIRQNQP